MLSQKVASDAGTGSGRVCVRSSARRAWASSTSSSGSAVAMSSGHRDDDVGRPLGPALDHDVELLEELAAQHEPRQSLGERSLAVEVRPRDAGAVAVSLVAPRTHAVECREDVLLGPVLGVEELHECLELEHRAGAGLRHPVGHCSPPLGGDRVDGARPLAGRLLAWPGRARARRASSVPRRACSLPAARTGREHGASAGRARRSSTA